MWPGQQPPGGERNPQHHPYQQPGHPPPPEQPPGFPPVPGGGPWDGAPAPAPDPQRKAGLTAVVAVAVAAAAVAGVLVITDDDKGSRAGSDVVQGPPGAPGSGGSGDSADPGGSDGPGGSGKLVAPAHSSGPGSTTVVIGEAGAGHTLDVYEDLRCPPCAALEQAVGPTVAEDIEDGKYRASFHFATIIDKNMGGSGSKNAVSALGAALNVSTDAFLDYKAALMSSKHHPSESEDSFADDSHLLTVAQEVPALKSSASFAEDVRGGTYDRWAREMIADFDASGVNGTPALKLDGSQLTGSGGSTPMTATEFTEAVNKQLKGG